MTVTTLQAGNTLAQESQRLGVPIAALQAATNITDPKATLETSWSIPNFQAFVDAALAESLPSQSGVLDASTANPAAGALIGHKLHAQVTARKKNDVSLEHDNRGDAGQIADGEVRPSPELEGDPRLLSYAKGHEKAFWIPEGLFITQMANGSDDPATSVDEASVPPGITTAAHKLKVDERHLITSGTGVIVVDGKEQRVAPGDVVLWPAGSEQRVINDGDELLKFWCICSPRFVPDDYEHVEDASVPYEAMPEIGPGQAVERSGDEAEMYFVSSGNGEMRVGSESRSITAGDLLKIPAGKSHEFLNDGDAPLGLQRYVGKP